MWKSIFSFCAFALLPSSPVETRRVEVVELNRYGCQPDGSGGTWQVIYWDRMWDGKLHVRHWRHVTQGFPFEPSCDGQGWSEMREIGSRMIEVRAWEMIETWSTGDPEAMDRAESAGWRRDLWK